MLYYFEKNRFIIRNIIRTTFLSDYLPPPSSLSLSEYLETKLCYRDSRGFDSANAGSWRRRDVRRDCGKSDLNYGFRR